MSEHSQTEMRSVLFTDLVGSTELRVRLGEERANTLRRDHDRLLGDVVTSHGGVVVKGLGDGIMATFVSAADAVAAAVAIEQAAEKHGRRRPDEVYEVRVGLSAGDVALEKGDVFGVPVVEASRLCASANGGEILVAELVRSLCRGRGAFQFASYGDLELKGLAEPLPTCRVFWEPEEDVESGVEVALPFPPLLVFGAPYVGRAGLLDRLTDALEAAPGAGCRMTLLAGEPGIGKTRTAAEVAHRAHAGGAVVLYGRSDEDLGAPYQPFMEALDFYTDNAGDPVLGRLPAELARLLPELPTRMPSIGRPVTSDPRSEEHLLFESTASWLVELARAKPVVLVLDDLHWADKPTLLLLLHVLRTATSAGATCGLFVVGTYRDTDIDRAHPLSGVLADLRRLPAVERLPVSGLSYEEVERFVATAAGHDLDDGTKALARTLHAETEGNPFFVAEVLRHLVETGAVVRRDGRWSVTDPGNLSVPEGVRDVIGRRLSRLSDAANEVLHTASVVGRDFEVELLMELSDLTESSLLDALDEAVSARIVDETGPDQYRFAHALVRTTLYEELSATRRRRLHRRVAEAIEKIRPDDVVALARHYVEAGPEGGLLARAVRYSLSAAEQSFAARALADAEQRYLGVLEVLDEAEIAEEPERVAALVGLGECQRDQANPAFRETLLHAARMAQAIGEVPLHVRAVLANGRPAVSLVGAVDEDRVAVAEGALEAIGPEPSADRARLLAYLAGEVIFSSDHARRLALTDEAEAMARALGDPGVLAWVITRTGFAHMHLSRIAATATRTEEAVRLADQTGDPALRCFARFWRAWSLLDYGRLADMEALVDEAALIATEASPSVQWSIQANTVRHLALGGRLDEAMAATEEVLRRGQELGEPDALVWSAAIQVGILVQREESQPGLFESVIVFGDQFPEAPTWRCGASIALVLEGRIAEARAAMDRYGMDAERYHDDAFELCGPACVAYLAYHTGDRRRAEEAISVLRPHARLWAHFNLHVMFPVGVPLGMAELLLGHVDDAVETLEQTLTDTVESGAVGLVPLCRQYLGVALLKRGGPVDGERAGEQLSMGRSEALAMGAPGLARHLAEIAELGGDPWTAQAN
ncbi:MAG TPA: hypothetical protein DCQ30_08590 [Acidimicrobiaceae bacterium]|nr:hypothetical protein [Acidimicrobiaceae bacterium]